MIRSRLEAFSDGVIAIIIAMMWLLPDRETCESERAIGLRGRSHRTANHQCRADDD